MKLFLFLAAVFALTPTREKREERAKLRAARRRVHMAESHVIPDLKKKAVRSITRAAAAQVLRPAAKPSTRKAPQRKKKSLLRKIRLGIKGGVILLISLPVISIGSKLVRLGMKVSKTVSGKKSS